MSNPAAKRPLIRSHVVAAIVCGAAGIVLFQFFGNATRGYIPTSSLFYWWGYQWVNPGSETEHGWLILGLSGWLWWRRLSKPETGDRKPETFGKPETGDRRPESLGKPETGNRRPESVGTPERLAKPKTEGNSEAGKGKPEETPETESLTTDIYEGQTSDLGSPVSGLRFPVSADGSPVSGFRFPVSSLAALLAGLALHAVGFAAQQTRVSIVAFLIFTWGVVRLGGGRRWGDAAMFPLGFMLFALPISVLDEIGLPLRLWVTEAGERIAHLAGIEVLRSGTQLVAPDGRFNYDVAAPCSGVRSLMALAALSVLIGYLNFRSWWRRLLVFGLCFPLVYVGNVARIVAIIFAAQVGGAEWGDRAHQVMGYGVFVIVLGGVLLAVALIHRWWPERRQRLMSDVKGQRSAGSDWPPEAVARSNVRTSIVSGGMIAIGVVTFAGAEMLFLQRLTEMPPRGRVGVVLATDGLNPVELPAFLGTDWIGRRAEVSAVEREMLPPDTGFSRKNYANVADRTRDVFLSIVLSGRDRTSIHRPELCLVGQGWTVDGRAQQTFRFPADGNSRSEFRATVLRVRREVPSPRGKIVVPQLVAYWFVAGDTVVPSHWQRFVHDTWNRVARARVDRWAYVLMQTDARDGEAAAIARMQTVLDATLPAFQRVRQ